MSGTGRVTRILGEVLEVGTDARVTRILGETLETEKKGRVTRILGETLELDAKARVSKLAGEALTDFDGPPGIPVLLEEGPTDQVSTVLRSIPGFSTDDVDIYGVSADSDFVPGPENLLAASVGNFGASVPIVVDEEAEDWYFKSIGTNENGSTESAPLLVHIPGYGTPPSVALSFVGSDSASFFTTYSEDYTQIRYKVTKENGALVGITDWNPREALGFFGDIFGLSANTKYVVYPQGTVADPAGKKTDYGVGVPFKTPAGPTPGVTNFLKPRTGEAYTTDSLLVQWAPLSSSETAKIYRQSNRDGVWTLIVDVVVGQTSYVLDLTGVPDGELWLRLEGSKGTILALVGVLINRTGAFDDAYTAFSGYQPGLTDPTKFKKIGSTWATSPSRGTIAATKGGRAILIPQGQPGAYAVGASTAVGFGSPSLGGLFGHLAWEAASGGLLFMGEQAWVYVGLETSTAYGPTGPCVKWGALGLANVRGEVETPDTNTWGPAGGAVIVANQEGVRYGTSMFDHDPDGNPCSHRDFYPVSAVVSHPDPLNKRRVHVTIFGDLKNSSTKIQDGGSPDTPLFDAELPTLHHDMGCMTVALVSSQIVNIGEGWREFPGLMVIPTAFGPCGVTTLPEEPEPVPEAPPPTPSGGDLPFGVDNPCVGNQPPAPPQIKVSVDCVGGEVEISGGSFSDPNPKDHLTDAQFSIFEADGATLVDGTGEWLGPITKFSISLDPGNYVAEVIYKDSCGAQTASRKKFCVPCPCAPLKDFPELRLSKLDSVQDLAKASIDIEQKINQLIKILRGDQLSE